ncbi:Peroxidase 45 [Hibiscus syriacus]|uniref:peroxidase n=1 Tax=Hibiscus syriacus TaxID=106335 RepID=A0A6A2X7Y0_HIBSY|nr:Peroxidase 45 [Hibiscus syriacus]
MDLTLIKAKADVDSVPNCRNNDDILALATRDTGGPSYAVELGRLDGKISTRASVRHHLPHPDFKLDKLKAMFGLHGLTLTDLVALSANSPNEFTSLKARAESILRLIHPMQGSSNICARRRLTSEWPFRWNRSPQTFDNMYYINLQQGKGLFTSDQILFTDARSRNIVNLFASNNTAFEEAFVVAITKLGRIGVKTGKHGEIRNDCSVVNKIF